MTKGEAVAKIKDEFISRYYEWLKDYADANLSDSDYGRKYGWLRSENEQKDQIKSVVKFQKYIYSGKYLWNWEKAGFDRRTIWELYCDGFLSLCENCNARSSKHNFYYISQKTAKEIYREYKNA